MWKVCKWELLIHQPTYVFNKVQGEYLPDYEHLLQENYMEYKHIFLPLLVSKILSRVYCYFTDA
jgi:hypothetical protein